MKNLSICLGALVLASCSATEAFTSPRKPSTVTAQVANELDVDIQVGTVASLSAVVPANSRGVPLPVELPAGSSQVRWVAKGQLFGDGARVPDDLGGATVPFSDLIRVTAEIDGQRYFSPRISQLFASDTISYKLTSSAGERCLGWQTGSGFRWGYYILRADSRLGVYAGPGCSPERFAGSWSTAQLQSADAATGLVSLNAGTPYRVSFSIAPASFSFTLGGTSTATAFVTQTDSRGRNVGNYFPVTWSSSSPAVASINNSGVITALSAGVTVISASNSAWGINSTAIVTVREPVPTRVNVCESGFQSFCYNSRFVAVGTSLVVRAEAFDNSLDITNRCVFTWRSVDPGKVAVTVNPDTRSALITRSAAGASSVLATCQGFTGAFTVN
jgi:hypothetical protein